MFSCPSTKRAFLGSENWTQPQTGSESDPLSASPRRQSHSALGARLGEEDTEGPNSSRTAPHRKPLFCLTPSSTPLLHHAFRGELSPLAPPSSRRSPPTQDRIRCSRVRRLLSEYPTFDFQPSTFNLPAWVFLRFLTPYLAVHEHPSSPHPVQPSAEIPLRISCFRLSTVDF